MHAVLTQERTRTVEIGAHVGQHVLLQGWLHAIRHLGGIHFLILRDGWGTAQIVLEEAASLTGIDLDTLAPESILSVEGKVVSTPQAPDGLEIHDPAIQILVPVNEPLPVLIGKREIKAALPTLLDHAVIVNRHPARRAIFRLAANVMAAFRTALSVPRFHGGTNAQDRCFSHGEWSQPVHRRLLWPAGLFGAKPTIL